MKKEIENVIDDIEEIRYHYEQLREDNEKSEKLCDEYDDLIEEFLNIENQLIDIIRRI